MRGSRNVCRSRGRRNCVPYELQLVDAVAYCRGTFNGGVNTPAFARACNSAPIVIAHNRSNISTDFCFIDRDDARSTEVNANSPSGAVAACISERLVLSPVIAAPIESGPEVTWTTAVTNRPAGPSSPGTFSVTTPGAPVRIRGPNRLNRARYPA